MNVKTLKLGDMDNNTYFVSDSETGLCCLIDPGYFEPALEEALTGVKDKLLYVLLTHRHFDHILAARKVKEITGAKICIHPKDACGLSNAAFSLAHMIGVTQDALTPDYTFTQGDVIRFGASSLQVLETPGHTVGSVCFVGEGCLFTGDTLFRLGEGRTDLPTGNSKQMLTSFKAIAALSGDYKIYPGHGKPSTLDVERTCNPFMIEALKV